MAITMWDHLYPGLKVLQASRFSQMDMTYFTFHRDLEVTHEDAMKKAVAAVDGGAAGGLGKMTERERDDFRRGVTAVLDYLEGFWMGLHRRPVTHAARSRGVSPGQGAGTSPPRRIL